MSPLRAMALAMLAVGGRALFVMTDRTVPTSTVALPVLRRQNSTLVAELRARNTVEGRAITTAMSTIYLNGDITRSRTANQGFDCRVDVSNNLWGFCATSVVAATSCGLVGSCVDNHACSSGCGFTNSAGVSTLTWYVTVHPEKLWHVGYLCI
jgi:hypothetical protein